MRHVVVKIKRDQNTVASRAVPEWEVAVLEYIFEEGNVERTETFEKVSHIEYPDAGVEFNRLVQRYGADPQSGVPYVASVFGNAGAGVRALRNAIEEAKDIEAEADGTPPPAPVSTPKRRTRAAVADSLLS